MTLRLPLTKKQMVIRCHANKHAAGYVLLTEDYSDTVEGNHNLYAPVAFGSRQFTIGQISLNMYDKEFLAMHLASDGFEHILWGLKEPTILMTD